MTCKSLLHTTMFCSSDDDDDDTKTFSLLQIYIHMHINTCQAADFSKGLVLLILSFASHIFLYYFVRKHMKFTLFFLLVLCIHMISDHKSDS